MTPGELRELGEMLKVMRDAAGIEQHRRQLLLERRRDKRRPRRAEQRAKLLERSVAWADRAAISEIYREAKRLTERTGIEHEVDHVIPLRGKLVSGLHVHQNLRIVTKALNRRKSNRFEEAVVGGAGFEPATSSV